MFTMLTITYGPEDRPIKLSLSPVIADKVEVSIERISVNSAWIDAKEAGEIVQHLKKEFGLDQWIPVTDTSRLPKKSGQVLGCMKDTLDMYVCFYRAPRKLFEVYGAGADPISDMKVTHWQPLPGTPSSVPPILQSDQV